MGNIFEVKAPNDPDEIGCVKAAAITRAQSRLSTEAKPLKVVQVTDQSVVTQKIAITNESHTSVGCNKDKNRSSSERGIVPVKVHEKRRKASLEWKRNGSELCTVLTRWLVHKRRSLSKFWCGRF